MRAFRPSYFAREEDFSDEADQTKQDNVQIYAKRAQAGLPLFGSIPIILDLSQTVRKLAANG
jgi:hypothetical protein